MGTSWPRARPPVEGSTTSGSRHQADGSLASRSKACPDPDPGWFTRGHKSLDQGSAPKPPGTLDGEVGRDVRSLGADWRELRVRRALGREFRKVERQALAEHNSGESWPGCDAEAD
jgi:hypothetical protein